jgi:hypothetical protein
MSKPFHQWKDFGAVAAFAHNSGFVVAQVVETPEGWKSWSRQGKELVVTGTERCKEVAVAVAEKGIRQTK